MLTFASLAVFSGLSLNLLLQFALGAEGIAGDSLIGKENRTEDRKALPFVQFGILFVSVLFLWTFFYYIIPDTWRGFSEYFLFFPLSALVCIGLEYAVERIFPRILPRIFPRIFPAFKGIKKTFSAFSAYNGLALISLFLTSFVAENFAEVFVLALFFVAGNMTAMIILNEIRSRSSLERVPHYLRGSPLTLISMGLLSLISAFAAGICFKILEIL